MYVCGTHDRYCAAQVSLISITKTQTHTSVVVGRKQPAETIDIFHYRFGQVRIDGASVTCSGRLLQVREAAT